MHLELMDLVLGSGTATTFLVSLSKYLPISLLSLGLVSYLNNVNLIKVFEDYKVK